jgi:hypothetical protein
MKKKLTLRNLFRKKENLLVIAMFALLLVFGCYEFATIDQPTEATTNSSFDVNLVMKEDDASTNDWTSEGGSLTSNGLFGVLLPEGWTVEDNIAVRVESNDSDLDSDGNEVTATSDHSGDYTLVYNADHSAMLKDSLNAPPGYYWWGAKTPTGVDMAFFDSLSFTITVNTDDQLGEFFLQYTVGDMENTQRIPMHYKSEPIAINISPSSSVNDLLSSSSLSVYPNPSYGHLNIDLKAYDGETVEMMMYTLNGKQIVKRNITSANTTLDIVDLAAGMYVIRLESGDEAITHKFVKK